MLLVAWMAAFPAIVNAQAFDHQYQVYSDLLRAHVQSSGVDYTALRANRASLERAAAALNGPDTQSESAWSREQRLAFWINAYNILTLRAIVDHYPIRSRWLTLAPRNSIRQIDGVWTTLAWPVAGKTVTLDDIEHRILRPVFRDPRIHFAINCASVSCPPLAAEPYRADGISDQLDEATRRFLASSEGAQLDGGTLRVSSLLKWYGGDFVEMFAPLVAAPRPMPERAILGLLSRYAPERVAQFARTGVGAIRFLDYNWSLNDRCGSC